MKTKLQKFGKFLSGMVMTNIGAFIAWGLITALFIPAGWFPNERLATLVGPILQYLLPILIGYQGGKMVGGDKGAITGAIATMGVIAGAEQTMLLGAMVIGPVSGLVMKKLDKAYQHKIKAGFEMLYNNFSVGIIGMLLAIIGYYLIGPFMVTVLAILMGGVNFLIEHGLLPLVAIFVEPAKVLFLNNAINHGIFTPIGLAQAEELGKSIMYMLETNPGPGLGVLLAYMVFSKNKVTKSSASGASLIHFVGGIHEIYFPYVLMNPIIIIAPIVASAVTIFYYSAFEVGLSASPAPGSIIAYLAVTPKGDTLVVLGGVLIATVISFVISSIIVKTFGEKDLEEAQQTVSDMKAESKGIKADGKIQKVVFACDAGMGSSAMGATKFRQKIAGLGTDVVVTNSSVDSVPEGTDIVVCQEVLKERAQSSAKTAQVITIGNFLADPKLEELYNLIAAQNDKTASVPEEVKEEAPAVVEETAVTGTDVMNVANIKLNLPSVTKEEAITAAGELLRDLGYVNDSYIGAMIDRENVVSTYIGLGVAIPHGTSDAKKEVKKTGIVFLQYPDGVDFGEEKAYTVFGIAALGDEHLDILAKIGGIVEDGDKRDKLRTESDVQEVLKMLI